MPAASKPEPTAKALVAGMLIMAWASVASSLSKTGSPSPGGQPRTTHLTTPPKEFPESRASLMAAIMASAAEESAVRTMLLSITEAVTASQSTEAFTW